MTARIGTCTGCGAQYGNIPPTVTATKVRCRKCGGEVEIPPLEAAPPPAPESAPEAAPPKPPGAGLTATPLGDAKPKGDGQRPAAAAPVDRTVARPEPPAKPAEPAPKPPPPKKPAPPKPPAPKAAPPKPPAPKKPAPPKPPAPKAAPPKPPAPKKPAPPKPAPAPATEGKAETPPAEAEAPKKDPAKAADLMAKLKAKKADHGHDAPASDSGAKKEKAADLMAKLKAKKAGDAAPQTPAPAAVGKGIPARKMPARPKAASKRKGREDDGGERHHHHHHHAKKGPPILMTLISVIALGGIGYGLWFFLVAAKDQPQEPTGTTAAADPAAAETAGDTTPAGGAADPVAEDPSGEPGAGAAEPAAADPGTSEAGESQPAEATNGGEEAAAEAAAPPPAQEPVGEDPEWAPPAAGEEIAWRGYRFPDSFKLELVPPLEQWSETDDETWAGYVEDAALYLADEGAQSTRAGKRLVEGTRDAYPAIVNAMLETDWSDHDSIGMCHSLNNLIVEIGQGTNFGWKDVEILEPGTPEYDEGLLFNKKVVIYWYNFWVSKFSIDDEQWDGFASKHSAKKPGEEKKKEAAPPTGGMDFDD